MKHFATTGSILAFALLLPLTACSTSDKTTATVVTTESHGAPAPATSSIAASVTTEVRKSIEQAKQELLTRDIRVDSVHVDGNDSYVDTADGNGKLPKVVITPQGTLVIAGKPVSATPAQHALLVDYRQQIIGIAEAGMDIGTSGAALGVSAAREAIFGALTGKSDKAIEASIKPQTDKIHAAAMQLCKRMPGLLASQQQLAIALPAFKPYATMTQKDVDDCGKKTTDTDGKKGFAVFSD